MVYRPFVQPLSPSTPLERVLTRLLRIATLGSTIICLSFGGYLLIGYSLHLIGVYTPTFAVLSLSDPFFILLGCCTGVVICTMSGSLLVLTLLAGVKDANAEFVILMSLIGFGFGAATVRVTIGAITAYLALVGFL
jgi:hypothetical protein